MEHALIHSIVVASITLASLVYPATTNAGGEDAPFGQAQTTLKKSVYKLFPSFTNTEYKYIMDIPKNHDIIVAVVDLYMGSDHDSLSGQYWVNEAERDGTQGVDDDSNGYIDDIHGWDFHFDSAYNPALTTNHGNQVVGVIAGKPMVENDTLGYQHRIRGVNPDVKIMRISKFVDPLIPQNQAKAIRYAVANNAKVINLSHQVTDENDEIKTAIAYAKSNGVFVVVEGPDSGFSNANDMHQFADVFAVAKSEYKPGQGNGDIYQLTGIWHSNIDYCLPHNLKAITNAPANNGTSFSAALLSGIIARLLMHDNTITHEEMRGILNTNSITSTGTDNNGSGYSCKRPSAELLFKNYYNGQILRQSVDVQHTSGKSAIFNIETVVDANDRVLRREIRHVNSGRHRHWVNQEVMQ
jgi:hypothetical protein